MHSEIAFLGTGLMGAPMISRLLAAGFRVHAWNRSPEKALPFLADGASLAKTPADAAAGASHVCLCLTDENAVRAVLFGEAGLASGLAPGTTVIDFSTIGPRATRELADCVTQSVPDVRWIDAPVTGGVRGAETGELVILCGGKTQDIAEVSPILAPLAKRVCHLGPLGSGQAAKLCNQLIVAVNVVAIAEALSLGQEHQLDLSQLPDALAGGWADSLPLQILGPRMAGKISDPPLVALGTFLKDLDLVADSASANLTIADNAAAILRRVISQFGNLDATALFACLEEGGPLQE